MESEYTLLDTIQTRFTEAFGDQFKLDTMVAKYTSARVGGPADMFLTVNSAEELAKAADMAFQLRMPYTLLGGGSNILVADEGIRGLVIFNRARNISYRHNGVNIICTAESGVNLSSLARKCMSQNLSVSGLEWGIGVPGTVGGAVVGNSGAFGADMDSNLLSATIWEPGIGVRNYTKEKLQYAYRDSTLKREQGRRIPRRVVLEAELILQPASISSIQRQVDANNEKRKASQPGGASMGSMFKNPENHYAGRLIELAGMKGFSYNGVTVSEKHANFFICDGGSAEDVRTVVAEVWHAVREKFGVEMELEIELVGDWQFEESPTEILEDSNKR